MAARQQAQKLLREKPAARAAQQRAASLASMAMRQERELLVNVGGGAAKTVRECAGKVYEKDKSYRIWEKGVEPWGWVVGALPPHPRTVDLKVSEMSAFGPPRGCASGSLWVKINKKG